MKPAISPKWGGIQMCVMIYLHYLPAATPLHAHVVAISCPVHECASHCPEEPILPPEGPPGVPHYPAWV